jgi:small subunit ribosomal protein S1
MEQSVVIEKTETEGLKTKMQITGKVLKTKLAGALIDIGEGKLGLLHISQIAVPDNQPIKRVEDVLKEGQEIEVWIKKVVTKDGEERVELTMFKPLDLEWKEIKAGMHVKGTVTRLEKFGAFVEIGAERPGLIHISEMAHGYVRTPTDVVKEGDEVEAEVIDVNRKKKQIKLSIKALQPEPVKEEPTHLTEPVRREKPASAKKKKVSKKSKDDGVVDYTILDEFGEPTQQEAEPTAMEIAMRAAMEKVKDRKRAQEEKHKAKAHSLTQQDLLTRTLESKPKEQ